MTLFFSLRDILNIPDALFCSESIHSFHKLGGIVSLTRYAMQPSLMLRSSVRAKNLLRLGPPLCGDLATLEAFLRSVACKRFS